MASELKKDQNMPMETVIECIVSTDTDCYDDFNYYPD